MNASVGTYAFKKRAKYTIIPSFPGFEESIYRSELHGEVSSYLASLLLCLLSLKIRLTLLPKSWYCKWWRSWCSSIWSKYFTYFFGPISLWPMAGGSGCTVSSNLTGSHGSQNTKHEPRPVKNCIWTAHHFFISESVCYRKLDYWTRQFTELRPNHNGSCTHNMTNRNKGNWWGWGQSKCLRPGT